MNEYFFNIYTDKTLNINNSNNNNNMKFKP